MKVTLKDYDRLLIIYRHVYNSNQKLDKFKFSMHSLSMCLLFVKEFFREDITIFVSELLCYEIHSWQNCREPIVHKRASWIIIIWLSYLTMPQNIKYKNSGWNPYYWDLDNIGWFWASMKSQIKFCVKSNNCAPAINPKK